MELEECFDKLKKITEKLESDKVGLDEGVKLFEEGAELVKKSLQELNKIKGKISVIKKDIENFVEEDLDD